MVDSMKLEGREKILWAAVLILIGVCARLALINYANIEPVLAISLVAGLILGGVYTLIVPIATIGLSDWLIYALRYEGEYGLEFIVAISVFTYSGFVIAGFIGRTMKSKLRFSANTQIKRCHIRCATCDNSQDRPFFW